MPLSDAQREHLGHRLREERTRVLDALARHRTDLGTTRQDAAGDLSTMPFHPADEGTDGFDQELDTQLATRLTDELRAIDDALERFYHTSEHFGHDERTGEEIPFERLDIVPWARTRVAVPESFTLSRIHPCCVAPAPISRP